MVEKIKSLLLYILLTIFFVLSITTSFYADLIASKIPYFSRYVLLIAPILCSIIVVYFLWRRERQVERDKYEFVSIATHKFRTPLSGIKWAIESMRNELTYEEKERILKQLNTAVDHLIEIIDLLVDFAKIDSGFGMAYEAASLHDMVEVSISRFSPLVRDKSIDMKIEIEQGLPLIVIDRSKIQFVVDMLIDNAVKYTPAKGTIHVAIYRKDKYLVMAIKDTGIGIPKLDLSHLFTKFYRGSNARTSNTEGMGLGLYAAKQIVTRHGGKIWVDSEGEGQGSTFYLMLRIGTYTGSKV